MVFNQELVQEFARLGLVYVHLIACCVALGLVIVSDLAMVRDLFRGSGPQSHSRQMEQLQSIVVKALAVLWLTGAAICALDASTKGGLQYFTNPKLQAKILMVAILTINGVALHHTVLPWVKRAGSVLHLSFAQTVFALLAGTVSGVSWLYAALLGVGRPLSWKYSLLEIVAAYPLLVAGGFMGMFMLTMWSRLRAETPAFAMTEFMPRRHA